MNGYTPGALEDIKLVYASDVPLEAIEWIWPGWLARSKLHLIAGAPEAGKTTIALSFAAAISSGNYWPDGTRAPGGKVLIWTSEDGIADTIVPRLTRMDANLKNIAIVMQTRPLDGEPRPFNPATDMPSLAAKAQAMGGVSMLMLDPVVAAVPHTQNSHNNAETRSGLQPVVDFAAATGAAVLGITHFTKGTAGQDPIERVTGSLAFGALPRIVMAAAITKDPAPGDIPRVLVRAKSNIGPSGGGFGYDIDAAPLYERPDITATRIAWLDPIDGTAKELLGETEPATDGEATSKLAAAQAFLKEVLRNGERPQREIMAEAENAGISEKTLRRAAKNTTGKRHAASGWYWWNLP
ncbi:MAG: AAA family ATPase [Methylocella sp.]